MTNELTIYLNQYNEAEIPSTRAQVSNILRNYNHSEYLVLKLFLLQWNLPEGIIPPYTGGGDWIFQLLGWIGSPTDTRIGWKNFCKILPLPNKILKVWYQIYSVQQGEIIFKANLDHYWNRYLAPRMATEQMLLQLDDIRPREDGLLLFNSWLQEIITLLN